MNFDENNDYITTDDDNYLKILFIQKYRMYRISNYRVYCLWILKKNKLIF